MPEKELREKPGGAQWRNHQCESVFQRLLKAVAVQENYLSARF